MTATAHSKTSKRASTGLIPWLVEHLTALPGGTPIYPKNIVAAVPSKIADKFSSPRSLSASVHAALGADGPSSIRDLVVKDSDGGGSYARSFVPGGTVPAQRAKAANHDLAPLMDAEAATMETEVAGRKRVNGALNELVELLDELGYEYDFGQTRHGGSLTWKWA